VFLVVKSYSKSGVSVAKIEKLIIIERLDGKESTYALVTVVYPETKLNGYNRATIKVSRNWLILLAFTLLLSVFIPLLTLPSFLFGMFAIRDPISSLDSNRYQPTQVK